MVLGWFALTFSAIYQGKKYLNPRIVREIQAKPKKVLITPLSGLRTDQIFEIVDDEKTERHNFKIGSKDGKISVILEAQDLNELIYLIGSRDTVQPIFTGSKTLLDDAPTFFSQYISIEGKNPQFVQHDCAVDFEDYTEMSKTLQHVIKKITSGNT